MKDARSLDTGELQKMIDRGRRVIKPIQGDFNRATRELWSNKGVQTCGVRAKCAHGLAFQLANKLLRCLSAGEDTGFLTDTEIENLYTDVGLEYEQVRQDIGGNKSNKNKLFPRGLPKNQDIVDLVMLLDTHQDSEKSNIQIAREFTHEIKDADDKARSLIRQIWRLEKQDRVNLKR